MHRKDQSYCNCMKTDSIPLTHPQKRIFLQTRLDPDSSWPVDLYLVKYADPIDFELLSRALNVYMDESDGLRIRLVPGGRGQVVKQCFFPHTERRWQRLDFSGSDEGEFERWKGLEKNRRFDIFSDILCDFYLMTFPDGKQGFSMNMHHICSDGFTRISVANRVTELYRDMVQNRALSVNTSAFYRDFVAYEQVYLKSPGFVRDREFWTSENLQELEEYRLAPKKVTDNSDRYGTIKYEIPEDLLQSMTQLYQNSGLSLFAQFFTALAVIVHRITSMDSFGISFFGHNRTREDMKATAGMFTGTYPLRIDINGNPTFVELAKYISGKIKKIIKVHGMFPFDELARLLHQKHQTDISHLINVSIIDLCYPHVPHCEMEHVHGEESQNQLSMLIERHENPELKSTILFMYDSRIYQESDIRNLFAGICSILRKAFLDTSTRIAEFPLVSPDEYEKLVHQFNDTTTSFPKDKCVHHLFEETALKNLSNTAIECGGRSISYGELNRQAESLAEKLRKAGIGPEKMVGVYMDKSIETVIAFLAVLKSGGAYVPIDPTLPKERIRFILQDTNPACVIVDQCFSDRIPRDFGFTLIRVENGVFVVGEEEMAPNCSTQAACPHSLMYVIYTSGSTGKPKGVMVEHRGFVNVISDQVRRYQLTGKDRFLHFISFSFDASQEHLFRVLCSGAVLCLVDARKNLNELDIRGLLKALGISCCAFPASLLETLDEKEFPALKTLSSGADKCSMSLVKRWSSGRRFYNSYGPTEATVLSTISQLGVQETEPHIGKPIANAKAYVLDQYRMPLPIGVEGELYIGGEGVARGYLNQPDLTRECFVENPFDPSGTGRMYRTGDIVYFRDDGNLVFVGRRDQQCKIRGFRIEPGEIKEALLQHPSVNGAAVLVHKSGGRQRLLAFFVPLPEESVDEMSLKMYLSEKLPAYEVPATLVAVDSIPLTIQGKTDEKRLLQYLSSHPSVKKMRATQSETECLLKNMWCEALDVKDVDITENFFYSGGDSLMTLEICMAIEKQFGAKITVQQFMQFPTIQAIAAILDREKREQGTVARVKKAETAGGSLVIIHGQNGECNYGHMIGRGLDDSLDIYAVSMDEHTLNGLNVQSMQDLAAFHVGQLLKQSPECPLLLCGFSWSGTLAYEMAVAFDKKGISVELLLIDTKYPNISEYDAGEKAKYLTFHFFRAIGYLFKPFVLMISRATKAGRERFQFSMDEALLELQVYLSGIKNRVWKGSPIHLTGKRLLKKYLRLLPARPSECPPSLRAHYIMTHPDSFLKKMLSKDQSAMWGKKMTSPLILHRLEGNHRDLIKKNLSITTKCIQNIINNMVTQQIPEHVSRSGFTFLF